MIFNMICGWIVRILLIIVVPYIIIGFNDSRKCMKNTWQDKDGAWHTRIIPWRMYLKEYIGIPKLIIVLLIWLILVTCAWWEIIF